MSCWKALSAIVTTIVLSGSLAVAQTAQSDAEEGASAKKPLIRKLGTIDCDLVETTPIVFHDRLYRFEYVRAKYKPNTTGDSYFRFIDVASGEPTPSFAVGYHLGSAMVAGDTVYVTGANTWGGQRVEIFASKDLKHWDTFNALNLPGFGIYNTSMCRAGDKYVLMFEIGKPSEEAGAAFTARFATSADLKHWELTPPECNWTKKHYSAPHALRYLDGYFYVFYLHAHQGYEMRVVRSQDLIHWEPSPLNPVLRASKDDKQIAKAKLTGGQRERIVKAVNRNNSDFDLCEFEGKVVIYYSWGNQQGVEHLAEAVYDGTLEELLHGFFPQ